MACVRYRCEEGERSNGGVSWVSDFYHKGRRKADAKKSEFMIVRGSGDYV